MKFELIPAGEFTMGSSDEEDDRHDNEGPQHKVTIAYPFYLGIYPVTQREWKEIMGDNPSSFKGDNRPVERVSMDDINEFIKKLNKKEGTDKYRLPSEAEWEYACRADTASRYSFGDDASQLCEYAWYDDAVNKTQSVGQKIPNPWGLYDMHGNVREWVLDNWYDDFNGAPTNGSAWKNNKSTERVLRGGSWYNNAGNCRSAYRENYEYNACSNSLGFRLLKEL